MARLPPPTDAAAPRAGGRRRHRARPRAVRPRARPRGCGPRAAVRRSQRCAGPQRCCAALTRPGSGSGIGSAGRSGRARATATATATATAAWTASGSGSESGSGSGSGSGSANASGSAPRSASGSAPQSASASARARRRASAPGSAAARPRTSAGAGNSPSRPCRLHPGSMPWGPSSGLRSWQMPRGRARGAGASVSRASCCLSSSFRSGSNLAAAQGPAVPPVLTAQVLGACPHAGRRAVSAVRLPPRPVRAHACCPPRSLPL